MIILRVESTSVQPLLIIDWNFSYHNISVGRGSSRVGMFLNTVLFENECSSSPQVRGHRKGSVSPNERSKHPAKLDTYS